MFVAFELDFGSCSYLVTNECIRFDHKGARFGDEGSRWTRKEKQAEVRARHRLEPCPFSQANLVHPGWRGFPCLSERLLGKPRFPE
jgi:hypothetical protein